MSSSVLRQTFPNSHRSQTLSRSRLAQFLDQPFSDDVQALRSCGLAHHHQLASAVVHGHSANNCLSDSAHFYIFPADLGEKFKITNNKIRYSLPNDSEVFRQEYGRY